jgi:hypothetical protein
LHGVEGLDEAAGLLALAAHGGVDELPAFVLRGWSWLRYVGGHFDSSLTENCRPWSGEKYVIRITVGGTGGRIGKCDSVDDGSQLNGDKELLTQRCAGLLSSAAPRLDGTEERQEN